MAPSLFYGIIVTLTVSALVFCRDYISFSDELAYPYIFGIMLALIFFRRQKNVNKKIEKVSLKLGGISYNIYLMHYGICYLFLKYFADKAYGIVALFYMISVFTISIIMNWIISFLGKAFIRK